MNVMADIGQFNSFFKKRSKRFLSIDFGRTFVKVLYLEPRDRGGFVLLDHDIKKVALHDESRAQV
ncbi:MAG: hypothetical protein WCI27_08100, partial [Candidatus Omnitrophota bacterium]